MYQGPGASFLFPEDWATYEAAIPVEERHDFIAAYGRWNTCHLTVSLCCLSSYCMTSPIASLSHISPMRAVHFI
jgi:proline iminopeptidase